MTIFAVALHPHSQSLPNKAIEYILGQDDWLRLFDGRLYLISSDKTSNEVADELRNVVPDEDAILVIPVSAETELVGFLPQQAWDWLRKYMPDLVVINP